MEIIKAHEQTIRSGASTLGDLAPTESDCSSARKRGDLGYFGRGEMQKEFEDVAFTLKVGELSDVVSTASGLHLIERYVLHARKAGIIQHEPIYADIIDTRLE